MPLSFDQGSLSFHDAAGAGWRGLLFEFNGQLSRDWTCRQHALSAQGGTIVMVAPDHDETLVLTVQAERGALVVSRTITNTGVAPLPLNSVTDGLLHCTVKMVRRRSWKNLNSLKLTAWMAAT